MSLQFIITDAGRAAIAQVGGAIGPVTLTKIALGSAGYTPLANRTALQTEIKRLDPSGSSVPVPGTISITAQDNSADSYSIKEIGLYTNNNVLFAICAQTAVIMTKASGSAALFAMDFVMTNVPAGTVTVGNVGFTYSQATETAMGVLGIATTAEAQAGIINTKIITPLRLADVTATETRRGVIALATTAEAQALAPDATKALTVARLVDRTANTGRAGVVVLASSTETQTGTDANKAVTPAGLKSTLGGYSASNHTHAIADTTGLQAALDSKTLPARLGGTAQSISNWNDALENGWYQSNQATNAPENVLDWWLGYVEVHTGFWVTQTVHRFTADAPTNTHIWRRSSSYNGAVRAWGDWYKLQLSQGEQDARYSLGTHNHPASAITSGTIDNARLNAATTSVAGIVELADNTETQTGTDTTRAVTPASLASRTATDARAGIVELATNTETQTGTDTTRAVTPASLASAAALFVPPGAVLPFAMNVVPSGWLAANGAAVSRTLYPALFAAIGTLYGVGDGSTTFALPDLRGYFVRGQGTNSDGTAAGTFGAKQADAFQGHIHTTSGELPTNNSSAGYKLPSSTVNVATGNQTVFKGTLDGSVIYHSHTISGPSTDGTNGTPRTASETRPKNIALLYCIKF